VVYFAAGHDPLAAKWFNAAPGQQHPLLIIDDTGNHRSFDLLLGEFHLPLIASRGGGHARLPELVEWFG
jgi:hypothetical protein